MFLTMLTLDVNVSVRDKFIMRKPDDADVGLGEDYGSFSGCRVQRRFIRRRSGEHRFDATATATASRG